jgi:hypothetical protein
MMPVWPAGKPSSASVGCQCPRAASPATGPAAFLPPACRGVAVLAHQQALLQFVAGVEPAATAHDVGGGVVRRAGLIADFGPQRALVARWQGPRRRPSSKGQEACAGKTAGSSRRLRWRSGAVMLRRRAAPPPSPGGRDPAGTQGRAPVCGTRVGVHGQIQSSNLRPRLHARPRQAPLFAVSIPGIAPLAQRWKGARSMRRRRVSGLVQIPGPIAATDQTLAPNGDTPIQAAWAQKAKAAQATSPSTKVTRVGPMRPGA